MHKIAFVVALLAVGTPASAQVDYDGIRGIRETFAIFQVDPADIPTWIDHQEEDNFTRETRNYVVGWGADAVLFMVASCDAVSIALGNRGNIFESGTVDTIWDDGEIDTFEGEDRNQTLVITDPEWRRRMLTHDELRIRVRLFQNIVASDAFALNSARLSTEVSPNGEATDMPHLRDVLSAIGCD